MMTCKQATKLISSAQDHSLGVKERLTLRMHLFMCKGCANFELHMKFMRKALRQIAGDSEI